MPPSQNFFFNFLSWYAAFWVLSDAFSDITRPVPNSLHSQHADSSDIIKPASGTLGKGCRAYFKGFFTGGVKRLKGQDVRVTRGIAFGRDLMRPSDRVYVNTIGLHFVLFVVGLPQFGGGGKLLALGALPLCPSLATGLA